jgi:serine phosphatase RsbU (regulator of sigma subunit)
MIGLDAASEAPTLAEYYGSVIDQIVECMAEGTYCALLGPRLSGKTHVLRHFDTSLAPSLGWTCVYIDLFAIKAFTQQGFFAELMGLASDRIEELTGQVLTVPEARIASSAEFRGFLEDAISRIGGDLVLIIEHLEALPTDLVQALLTSLRAAYMDQQLLERRVLVVVSGALSLATLTVGESSPFRGIARRVFVGDLTREESQSLIAEQLLVAEVEATARAKRRLLRATSGDPYLIRRISQLCIDTVDMQASRRLRGRTVRSVIREFLRESVYEYGPLQEAVRLIEEDPDLLRGILLLLAHGTTPKASLPLPLSPDLDPLYLTGVVEQVDGDRYRIQNQIYHRFLAQHFQPGHVGHVLAMAGLWDPAIDYLEAAIKGGDGQARADLLPAVVNSMYAAEDIGRAARFLARGLQAGFGVVDARIWYAPPRQNHLQLVAQLGPRSDGALWMESVVPIEADRLEARSYRQGRALRGLEGTRHVWRAMPILVPGRRPIGTVTVCEDLVAERFSGQRERDLQLRGYLNQAARAMQAVSTRRQELALAGQMQSSLFSVATPEVPGWQTAATMRPAREASGDYYDFIPLSGDRVGLVIADVADKGLGAALYMVLSRTMLRTFAARYPDRPDLALDAANARILTDTEAGLFVTVFYGILDPSEGTLTYCNAGHHSPYLIGSKAPDRAETLAGRGIALGVVRDPGWTHTTLRVPPGAALLLYTDGVLDARNSSDEPFGADQMLEAAETHLHGSAQELLDAVLSRLQLFVGDNAQFDDITLMTLIRNHEHEATVG